MIPEIPHLSFKCVLADPPWSFQNWSEAGEAKNAKAKYPCESTEDIIKIGPKIGLDFVCDVDCGLVMWATAPLLPDAVQVMRAWGFKYVTAGAWAKRTKHGKTAFGTGYWLRSAAEFWLIGVRGAPSPKARNVRNLIDAPVREHSRKPDDIYDVCERLFDGPYLELFARQAPRPGWTAWGNEVGKFAQGGAAA
jgi:N6-adenosine-specific RNA methylase IME4